MNVEQVRGLAWEDAVQGIELARERPIAGLIDTRDKYVPVGENYRYSPEIPARRWVTEWDDYKRNGELPDPRPPVFTRVGRARQVWDIKDQPELWDAYLDAFIESMKGNDVVYYETYTPFYGGPDPFLAEMEDARAIVEEIHSIYVVDEKRYAVDKKRTAMTQIGTNCILESTLMPMFKPKPQTLKHRVQLKMGVPIQPRGW
jgi:hypothetical protein